MPGDNAIASTGVTLADFGDVMRLERLRELAATHRDSLLAERLGGVDLGGSLTDAWPAVAPLTKADILQDQQQKPPFGRRLLSSPRDVTLVVESSGSSGGEKEIHALSRADEDAGIGMMTAAMRTTGLGPDDTVALTLPIGTAGGGWKLCACLRAAGALVLRIGSLGTDEKVERMLRFGVTALVGTPVYVDRLAAALDQAGHAPASLAVRHIYVATQAVTEAWVARTEKRWGARVFEWYGNAAGFFAMTCGEGILAAPGQRGTLHWDPSYQLLEVLSPEGALVQHGERGEIVGTHLMNQTGPLVRFATGDSGRFVRGGGCRCGSAWPGLEAGTIRRLDAMLKVRGVNLWPGTVESLLVETPGVEDFWVIVSATADGREELTLFVRASSAAAFNPAALEHSLRQTTGLRFDVRLWEQGGPPDAFQTNASGKTPRWIDVRQQDGS
ncbi:MAG: AMP-binding protein [Chloroflexi bacterium]|nr:AMP-binding protein [Chloroflexota bacterium]